MAATLTGVMRSPFTSIVFAVELTHDVGVLLPLLVACGVAHLASVLGLPRSILTEKIARRGFHVSREYAVDPLQALFVREVMADAALDEVHVVRPDEKIADLYSRMPEHGEARRQRLFPVMCDGRMTGVLSWSDVLARKDDPAALAAEVARAPAVVHPDQTLRQAADVLVSTGHGVLPVVDRAAPDHLCGLITQFDLLRAHERVLVEERHRERPLRLLSRVGARD
jgi:CBS domain-containing protein